jgi:AcrR family transcriptional regulator
MEAGAPPLSPCAGRSTATLSLREVAADAGTTTHAIYTLFGSRNALLVALGARAFNLLQQQIEALPAPRDLDNDLVQVALIFRRFALEHPALFSIAFHRADPALWPRFRGAAIDALAILHKRFQDLHDAGCSAVAAWPRQRRSFGALGEGV